MRRASISNLAGRFGTITASGLWNLYSTWKLDGLFVDARAARASDLAEIAKHGRPGILVDPSWPEVPDGGAGCATWTLNRLNQLGFVFAHRADPCDVLFDNETHDMAAILTMFRTFRASRAVRQLWWSPEPFQGGLLTPELVDFINADVNLGVLAETYQHPSGLPDMQPCAADAVRADLTRNGIADVRAKLFYPSFYETAAAVNVALPQMAGWDGAIFDLDHAA